MTTKTQRLIWGDYNKSLCNLGNLFVWVCEDFLKTLNDPTPEEPRKRGRPVLYKDSLIELVLSIRYVLGFPLRQVTGLCQSLFPRMGIPIDLPDYTTLCRRSKKLSDLPHIRNLPLLKVLNIERVKNAKEMAENMRVRNDLKITY